MPNPLAAHPPWRQVLVLTIALPVIVTAAVLAFAWPAGRIQPRDLPIGVVGSGTAGQQLIAGLDKAQPGGFEFRLYADADAARRGIEDRDVYGAFVVAPPRLTVLEASAAGPTVAQLLTSASTAITAKASAQATAAGKPALTDTVTDVVPLSRDDPRGTIFSSSLLPLTICSILIASAIGIVVKVRPAWRHVVALLTTSAAAGAGVYLIAQSWLGALPHDALGTWASVSLTILAINSATAGLIALFGLGGFALAAALMVFVGNSFAGVTSAPELLPGAVRHIGQWLPPGAGAELLRSAAYFDGNGAGGHLAVLLIWIALGFAAIVVGHHAPIRFAANADTVRSRPEVRAVRPEPAREPAPALADGTAGSGHGTRDDHGGGAHEAGATRRQRRLFRPRRPAPASSAHNRADRPRHLSSDDELAADSGPE